MDANEKQQSLKAVYVGLAMQVAGWAWSAFFPIEAIRRGGPLLISAGTIAIIFATVKLAKAKGYDWYYGLLSLFCGLLGYGIVWFGLKDKSGSPRE
ncbi:MAG TPA: hypothetical protein VL400_11840 [Polyangiaceae bacterium]|jgi:hypothetical protein|nr:hypothetical protein [Polyangiaceae bacterium]